jgi:polyisoprenoid-binding protein YceI
MAKSRSRTVWIIAGIVGAIVVIAVVAPFVYIHFINGDAPKKLSIDSSAGTTEKASAATAPLDGTWKASTGSVAGYRVQEVLFGQSATAVGRTTKVTGRMTIAGNQVTAVTVTVDMASVTSDRSQRDGQFRDRFMDVSTFPTSAFTLTSPIDLATPPANGTTVSKSATGNLTLHGTTKPVTVTLQARRDGNTIKVVGSIPVTFADYGIEAPDLGFVKTQDHGLVEFLVNFEPS